MPMIQRTAQAEEDLIELWTYIAAENPNAADRVLDEIEKRCFTLAENPLMGRPRPDIAPELRYFVSGQCLILYREVQGGIQLVRVVHGARDLSSLF